MEENAGTIVPVLPLGARKTIWSMALIRHPASDESPSPAACGRGLRPASPGRCRDRRRVGVLGGFRREDRAGVLALARLPEVPAPGLQPRATAGPGRNRVRLPHAVHEQFPGGRAALRRAEYPAEQLTQSALRKLLAVRERLPLTTDKEDQPARRPEIGRASCRER